MFKKLIVQYKLVDMDTSCCAILFCKAAELQVKECFYEGLKNIFLMRLSRDSAAVKVCLRMQQRRK